MSTSAASKPQRVKEFSLHTKDTGSAPVQVALLTDRINQLSAHLQGNKKDASSRRGLLKMIGKRSSLLKYLHRTDRTKYQEVIQKLGLRK